MNEASCPSYREQITAWEDGEVKDAREVAALEDHLRHCEGCRVYAEAESAAKTLVATAYARPVEVRALRARIRDQLDTAAPRLRWFPLLGPRLAWGALAAILLAALAVSYLTFQPKAAVEASPLVRAAVTDHVECMLGRLPLDLTTTDQNEISRWLRGRLARPVGLAPLAPEGEVKMSARPARLASAEGTQVLVERGGRMLSLFIMPLPEISGTLGRRVARDGREFFLAQLEGYTVVFWRQGDLLYCLVADGPEDEVLSVAARYATSSAG